MENIYKIGETDSPDAQVVRIVHISDTHMQHEKYLSSIPDGDVIIHSGDFGSYSFKRNFNTHRDFTSEIQHMDSFFAQLPHKYKLFIAGNHETSFPSYNPRKIQNDLKNAIYLQDSSVTINGIKIYGSPWNNYRVYSFARSFALSSSQLQKKWSIIPDDVDILVTHLPPYGIMDLACVSPWKKLWRGGGHCSVCGHEHSSRPYIEEHWGCESLRERVFSKSIKAHLFGHVHGCNGVVVQEDILFSNAALKCKPEVNVIDYYTTKTDTYLEPEYPQPLVQNRTCHTVML